MSSTLILAGSTMMCQTKSSYLVVQDSTLELCVTSNWSVKINTTHTFNHFVERFIILL